LVTNAEDAACICVANWTIPGHVTNTTQLALYFLARAVLFRTLPIKNDVSAAATVFRTRPNRGLARDRTDRGWKPFRATRYKAIPYSGLPEGLPGSSESLSAPKQGPACVCRRAS